MACSRITDFCQRLVAFLAIFQFAQIMFVQKIFGVACVMMCLNCLPCVSTQFQGNVLQEAEAMLKADCGDACLRVEAAYVG